MSKENNTSKGISKRVITILLVLNLALSGGIAGHMVFIDHVGTKAQAAAVTKEDTSVGAYVLYIGTNDKDTYKQKISTKKARKIVNNICKKYVEGYTTYDAQGGWVDETGVLTQENTLVYMFQGATREQIKSIMDETLKKLNQNSIMVETRNMNSSYYDGSNENWG